MEYKEFIDQVKVDLPERLSGTLEGAMVNETQVKRIMETLTTAEYWAIN